MIASLGHLLLPLVSPRRGLSRFLRSEDRVSLPLFGALLGHFFATVVYVVPLRAALRGASGATLPPELLVNLTAAIPFISSLVLLLSLLFQGILLYGAARMLGVVRPYGEWAGLAGFAALPGILRILLQSLTLSMGIENPLWDRPAGWFGANLPAGWLGTVMQSLDGMQVWSLVVLAFGFAAYAGTSARVGTVVALVVWLLTLAVFGGLDVAAAV